MREFMCVVWVVLAVVGHVYSAACSIELYTGVMTGSWDSFCLHLSHQHSCKVFN